MLSSPAIRTIRLSGTSFPITHGEFERLAPFFEATVRDGVPFGGVRAAVEEAAVVG